jgi:peptidoglycan/xylan/chitin deacetylase (PgdA/CDA1 family)
MPFYHLVSDMDVMHIKNLYSAKKIKEFERDLDFYLKYYVPLSPVELISPIINDRQIKKAGFLLSFDDGLREFNDVIAPILLKKGIPAICFLNSGFIDNKDLFYRYKASILIEAMKKHKSANGSIEKIKKWVKKENLPFDEDGLFLLKIKYINRSQLDDLAEILGISFRDYLNNHQPYMTKEQIFSLKKQGFTFGAHSIDHPYYSDLSLTQQLNQTIQSIEEISHVFSLNYRLFSFPFTDYAVSREFFNTLYADNSKMVDLTFGSAGLKQDEFNKNLQRIPMETDHFSAEDIIYGEYFYYLFKTLLNKNMIKR